MVFRLILKIVMKRTLLILCILALGTSSYAQPRSAGLRLGITGVEASYQHTMQKNQFIEGEFGLDYGYNMSGAPGIKATGIYNFIWAHPAWTNKGKWALYAGPGASMGWVHDQSHIKIGNEIVPFENSGFMLGFCAQVGLEYTFWFPLQISLDIRPTIAMHVNSSHSYTNPITGKDERYSPHVGFYDNGLLGLAPHISVRYRF